MKRLAIIALLGLGMSGIAYAQSCPSGGITTCTPNLSLFLPPSQYQNWNVPTNANWNSVDAASAFWAKLNAANQTFTGTNTFNILNVTTLNATTTNLSTVNASVNNVFNAQYPPSGLSLTGITCNGSTNDSTAAQAIINAAGAAVATTGSAQVLIPCHTKLNVTVPANVTLQCLNGSPVPVSSGPLNPQSLLIDGSSGATAVVTLIGNGAAVKNCGFQGTGSGAGDIGILVNSTAPNFVIDNNSFNGFGLSGISVPNEASNGGWVTNNKGQSLLLNARGGTWVAPVGALDLEGNDTKVFNNEFTASTNATLYNAAPEAFACVSGGKAQFWELNVCEESEGGLYVKEYAGAGGHYIANRADLNGGMGFSINDGCGASGGGGSGAFGGDTFVGNTFLSNSSSSAGTYDDLLVNCGTNNTFQANISYRDATHTVPRYGFNDASSETHTFQFLQFNRWDTSNQCLNQVTNSQSYTGCFSSTTTVDNFTVPFGQNKMYLGNMYTDGSTFGAMQLGILGTYTDNSDYGALQLGSFDGNNYFIQPAWAGTGTHGGLVLGDNGTAAFKITTAGIGQFLTQQLLYSTAGCATATTGQICYDTTNLNWHAFIGSDLLIAMLPTSGLTSGNLPVLHESTAAWSLQDAGFAATKVLRNCGTLTLASSSTTSALSCAWVTTSSTCSFAATSSSAAGLVGGAYYAPTAGTFTLTHASAAGTETYAVACSAG